MFERGTAPVHFEVVYDGRTHVGWYTITERVLTVSIEGGASITRTLSGGTRSMSLSSS